MTARQPRRPNGSPPHPTRSVRIGDDVWDEAKARAELAGVTMSHVLNLLVEGYARHELDLPRATYDYYSTKARKLTEAATSATAATPHPTPTQAKDLVRVVDLQPRASRHADPDIFHYAVFEDQVWLDVHNVKDLLKRLTLELWSRDPDLLGSTENGKQMVQSAKERRRRYMDLPGGRYLYMGWATQYLLAAAQEFVIAFELSDQVAVQPLRLSPSDHHLS